MQFMLMCCFDEKKWAALPEAKRDEIMEKYGQFVDDAKKSGYYITGAKLDDSATAITVHGKNGKSATMDGPFAETKEQLGGFHIVECVNLNEAVELARRIPTVGEGGTIEVRTVLKNN